MNYTERSGKDRRAEDPTTQPVERRSGEERRVPRWLERARDGALYGYGPDGKPIAGKILR